MRDGRRRVLVAETVWNHCVMTPATVPHFVRMPVLTSRRHIDLLRVVTAACRG